MERRVLFLIYICILIGLFSLTGCSNLSKPNDNSIDGIVASYYKSFEPSNKGVMNILAQKPIDQKTLVLAEKYSGDGHSYTELFLINSDNRIEKRASGFTPMSMCFSANIMEYENKTIVFGNFNDAKWEIEPDIKKSVNIQRILVKFKSGETVEESVDKGYIIYSKALSDVEVVELYDNNGVLQSNLNDLRRYGMVFNEASFVDLVQK